MNTTRRGFLAALTVLPTAMLSQAQRKIRMHTVRFDGPVPILRESFLEYSVRGADGSVVPLRTNKIVEVFREGEWHVRQG